MRILPVLDIMGGVVVRAVGGRRSEYRPLVSRLTDSTEPLAVAEAIRRQFGWDEFYIADLDAITREGEPAAQARVTEALACAAGSLFDRFRAVGFRIWLDAGVRDTADAIRMSAHVSKVIAGSETIRDLATYTQIVERLGPERAVFSLDMRDGRPTSNPNCEPIAIADTVIAAGCRHLIVLDLGRVGTGNGTGTESLCAEVARRHLGVAVYAGGGIRNADDIRRLEDVGVAGALVASAIHDGVIEPNWSTGDPSSRETARL
jgi:phosphoribosylformimino-5-aminoimidazole carboxamide ribotide isomerase